MTNKKNIIEAIRMLKGMLKWSDRIGSDEIGELKEIIKVLEGKYK